MPTLRKSSVTETRSVTETPSLILGDCREVMRRMGVGTVDAVVTDPPFGIAYTAGSGSGKRMWGKMESKGAIVGDDGVEGALDWLPFAYAVLRDGGVMLVFTRWDVACAWRAAI